MPEKPDFGYEKKPNALPMNFGMSASGCKQPIFSLSG